MPYRSFTATRYCLLACYCRIADAHISCSAVTPIYPPGCAFETRVECEVCLVSSCRSSAFFSIFNSPRSDRRIGMDDDDDRNGRSNMEGWVWTEQHMRHFDLYSHCQLTSHTWMGDGCAVMCCLPTYLSLSMHRILVVLARACVCCCEVQGSLRPIVPLIPSR
jgi:hypothetical protein